jgi:hypothetical protein
MNVSSALKKSQLEKRLKLKTAEAAFERQIVSGTNCSPFESEIITEKAKEIFGVGPYAETRTLLDGQMIFFAVSAEAPPGVKIEDCHLARVVLTHIQRDEDLEAKGHYGLPAKRRQQIMRMTVEAQEQGALLTQEDLALILDCDPKTIRGDIKALREEGLVAPTRGTVRDIGPGVSHKRRAVELWLAGKEPLDAARQLNHSLKAVERYIQAFCRVVYAQRTLRDILQTALVVGISVPAANTYWELHCELCEREPAYAERLEEVMQVGEDHWQAADQKKSRSRTANSKRKERRPA